MPLCVEKAGGCNVTAYCDLNAFAKEKSHTNLTFDSTTQPMFDFAPKEINLISGYTYVYVNIKLCRNTYCKGHNSVDNSFYLFSFL